MSNIKYKYNNDFVDFTSNENKTVLVVDVQTQQVLEILTVNPINRLKMIDLVRNSRVTWNYPSIWSGLPVDSISIDTLYQFYIVESTDENLFFNIIVNNVLNSNNILYPKTLGEVSTAVIAAGLTLFDLELPKLYAGYAEPNNPLFVEPAMPA
jgi:hypothetical protein